MELWWVTLWKPQEQYQVSLSRGLKSVLKWIFLREWFQDILNPVKGTAWPHLESSAPETYAIRETFWTNTITFEIQEVRWVIRYPLHARDSGFKSRCALSLLKLRSRYETDCIIFIPCEGNFSLVLLVMFSHPYPTLVPSYPHPYSHLEKPIVLVWETWDVVLFRHLHPLWFQLSAKKG